MKSVYTFLYQGSRPVYTADHVIRTKDMVAEHLKEDHHFYCVTNEKVQGVETIPLPFIKWVRHVKGIPSNYYKLYAFSLPGEKIVIDLDAIISKDITDLFTDDPFKILKGVSCPYNSSLMQINGQFDLWDTLTERSARKANLQKMRNGKRYFGSDQAVIADKLRNRPTWDSKDGLYQYAAGRKRDFRILFFAGKVKPWDSEYADMYWGR